MDIIEQIATIVDNTENYLRCNREILDILKNKKKFYIEQFTDVFEVKNRNESNLLKNGKFYRCDIFDVHHSLYNSEESKSEKKGELKKITTYEDISYFLLVEEDFNIRFFISQVTNILNGNISSGDGFCFIETKDVAYEITKEEIEIIDKLLKYI